jgi:integrase
MGGRRHVLGVDPGYLNGVVRASVKRRVPVVMTPAEVQKVLEQLDGTPAIVCRLITPLRSHLEEVRGLHASDLAAGLGKAVAVQELLGHSDVRTTMIYTHGLNRGPLGIRSPADLL